MWASPIFSGLTASHVQQRQMGSGHVRDYRTWSLLCYFLFWGPQPRSELICCHLPSLCALWVGSRGQHHQHDRGQAGRLQLPTPSHGHLPHRSLQGPSCRFRAGAVHVRAN